MPSFLSFHRLPRFSPSPGVRTRVQCCFTSTETVVDRFYIALFSALQQTHSQTVTPRTSTQLLGKMSLPEFSVALSPQRPTGLSFSFYPLGFPCSVFVHARVRPLWLTGRYRPRINPSSSFLVRIVATAADLIYYTDPHAHPLPDPTRLKRLDCYGK